MRVLDLFCGLGGASMGYVRAGLDASGVDHSPQPEYPFAFVKGDALSFIRQHRSFIRREFVLVHASPPCQAKCTLTLGTHAVREAERAERGEAHLDLYPETKELLEDLGLPYVIENPSARPDVVLCGAMLGTSKSWGVLRHRNFELGGWTMPQPPHERHQGYVRGWRHGVYRDGVWPDGRVFVQAYGKGGGKAEVPEIREAMDISWATERHQLIEAIPPYFTAAIGRAFLAQR